MRFHDRVRVEAHEPTGATDEHGNPVLAWVDKGPAPAEVRPLGSVEVLTEGRDAVVNRYRVFLSRRAPVIGPATADLRFVWRQYGADGTGHLMIDGAVEQHTLNRRLRFFSFVTKSVVG